MRTILDTKNTRNMFSCEGCGGWSANDNFDAYEEYNVDKDDCFRKKLKAHIHNRHQELIEFYGFHAESYYEYGMDAF